MTIINGRTKAGIIDTISNDYRKSHLWGLRSKSTIVKNHEYVPKNDDFYSLTLNLLPEHLNSSGNSVLTKQLNTLGGGH